MVTRLSLTLVAVLAIALPCAADSQAQIASVSLTADKSAYVMYEPVVLTWTIRNESGQPLNVPSGITFQSGAVRLETSTDGKVYSSYATGPQALTYRKRDTLATRGTKTADLVVLTNVLGRIAETNPKLYEGAKVFPFNTPGKHFVRASVLVGNSEPWITSNVLEIVIVAAPTGEEVTAYFPSLDDYAAAVGADYTTKDVQAAAARWESFVRANPGNRYAPFVAYRLANLYLEGIGVTADPVRAIELYSIAAEGKRPALVPKSLVGMAKSQVGAGRFDEAKATAEEVLGKFKDSSAATEARRIRDGLAQGARTLHQIYGR